MTGLIIEKKSPGVVAAPVGPYSHLVRVHGDADWVFVSGQVGMDSAGEIPGDIYAQAINVFGNIEQLLRSEGLEPRSLVRLLTFVVDPENMPEYRRARDEVLSEWFPSGDFPGQSLMFAAALARPDILLEIEGWAVAPREYPPSS